MVPLGTAPAGVEPAKQAEFDEFTNACPAPALLCHLAHRRTRGIPPRAAGRSEAVQGDIRDDKA